MNRTMHELSSAAAILTGIFALAYAYFFVIAKDTAMYSLFLLLLGLTSLGVVVILFGRLKGVHEDLARLAMVLGILGALGAIAHGGYDLANAINPPGGLNATLPSQIDPRGLLTFGLAGIALLKFSALMQNDKHFPNSFVMLGFLSGILMIIIYIARLTVLSPANPVLLYPVLLEGFIVNPLWYIWLGVLLKKQK